MKKTLKIITTVFLWTFIVATVGVMIFTIISVNTFDQKDRSFLGYQFFIVKSDSMSATDFSAGDVVFTEKVDTETLKEGDIIAFVSRNSSSVGEIVTHKIRKITKDHNGEPAFITFGTTTNKNDESIVTSSYVVGKYVGRIPEVGKIFKYIKTVPGYILCIFTPFFLLILYHEFECVRLFRKYKREQEEILKQEREKIEEERRELLALKGIDANEGQQSEHIVIDG